MRWKVTYGWLWWLDGIWMKAEWLWYLKKDRYLLKLNWRWIRKIVRQTKEMDKTYVVFSRWLDIQSGIIMGIIIECPLSVTTRISTLSPVFIYPFLVWKCLKFVFTNAFISACIRTTGLTRGARWMSGIRPRQTFYTNGLIKSAQWPWLWFRRMFKFQFSLWSCVVSPALSQGLFYVCGALSHRKRKH